MRKLMWFTVGFALSCGLGAYGIITGWMIPGILAAGAAALGFCQKKWKQFRIFPVIAGGILLGNLWMQHYRINTLDAALALEGTQQQLCITATDYGYDTGYSLAVDGEISLEGKQFQIRVYLPPMEQQVQLQPGDQISGLFDIRTTVPGGMEESTYQQSKGIYLLGYGQEEVQILPGEAVSPLRYPALLAGKIGELLKAVFPEDVYPFAKALLLGDSRELSYETDTALKLSGIRHIIAVSGLHVSVLYGAVMTLTRRRPWLTALVAIPVLMLFAAVAGFTPSVSRSCFMVGLMILAGLCMRRYDSATAMSFALLVMLLGNPMVATSASLQLSVGCVGGIISFQKPVQDYLLDHLPGKGRWKYPLASSISVSVSAMVLITPLSAAYFGCVSLVGVLTNLLTLWVVNGIFIGTGVVCLVSFVSMAIAEFLAGVVAWPMRFVLAVAGLLAKFPLSAVYTCSLYIVMWLVFCYLLLLAFCLQRKKQPGKLLCSAAFGLCIALSLSWTEPMLEDLRITMLDVGQGQSILIRQKNQCFLIDCGGDKDTETADIIAENLLSQGVTRLDGLIVTHYDRDHAGALENLLSRIDVQLLILPDTPNQIHPQFDGKLHYLWDTTEIALKEGKFTVFGPIYHGISNENSLCVLFESEKCDILITGDRTEFGERMLMRKWKLPDVDILVAGHHGAESSSSNALLRTVQPELVLISVGEGNYYGHPNPKLLQRLSERRIAVRRTDLEGTIILRR